MNNDFPQDKTITIKQSDYNKMCDYLNQFVDLVERQDEEIKDLKDKLKILDTPVSPLLDKYKKLLKVGNEL